jgi:hypothetical protein
VKGVIVVDVFVDVDVVVVAMVFVERHHRMLVMRMPSTEAIVVVAS